MIVVTALKITIVACTFIGNLFVIIAILIDKNLQTPANQLVLSLAVADLMVGCLVMPLGTYNDYHQGWWLGKEVCEFWTSADVLCCTGEWNGSGGGGGGVIARRPQSPQTTTRDADPKRLAPVAPTAQTTTPPDSLHLEPARHSARPLLGGHQRRLHLQADAQACRPDDLVRVDGGRDRLVGAHLRLEGSRFRETRARGAQVPGEPGRGLPDIRHHIDLLCAARAPAGPLLAHLQGKLPQPPATTGGGQCRRGCGAILSPALSGHSLAAVVISNTYPHPAHSPPVCELKTIIGLRAIAACVRLGARACAPSTSHSSSHFDRFEVGRVLRSAARAPAGQ
jgi:hypothetical protein